MTRHGEQPLLRRDCTVFALAMLCGASLCPAADGAEAAGDRTLRVLTMEEAVSLTQLRNPRLAAAQSDARAAEFAARSLLAFPLLDFELEPQLELPDDSSATEFSLDVVARQPLDLSGRRRWTAHGLREIARAGEHAARETELDVLRDVQIAFADLLETQERVTLVTENFDLLDELRRLAERGVNEGRMPQTDLLKFQVEFARAQAQLELARGQVEVAQAALAQAIGDRTLPPLHAAGELPRWRLERSSPDLVTLTLATRPIRQAAEALVRAAEASVRASRSRRLPDVALVGRREFGETSLGLGLFFPLVDTGEIRNEVRSREEDQRAAVFRRTTVETDLQALVLQRLAEFQSAQRRVDRLAGVVDAVRELTRKAQIGYLEGANTRLDVLEAQRTMRDVLLDALAARADLARAAVRLASAVGFTSPAELLCPTPAESGSQLPSAYNPQN